MFRVRASWQTAWMSSYDRSKRSELWNLFRHCEKPVRRSQWSRLIVATLMLGSTTPSAKSRLSAPCRKSSLHPSILLANYWFRQGQPRLWRHFVRSFLSTLRDRDWTGRCQLHVPIRNAAPPTFSASRLRTNREHLRLLVERLESARAPLESAWGVDCHVVGNTRTLQGELRHPRWSMVRLPFGAQSHSA